MRPAHAAGGGPSQIESTAGSASAASIRPPGNTQRPPANPMVRGRRCRYASTPPAPSRTITTVAASRGRATGSIRATPLTPSRGDATWTRRQPAEVVHRIRYEHAAGSDLAQNWSMSESRRTSPLPGGPDLGAASDPRRTLPKVDVLLAHPTVAASAASLGRAPVLGAVRRVLDSTRRAASGGEPVPGVDQLAAMVTADLDSRAGRRMRAVINATGVVLHTNLGRAPLSEAAVAAIVEASGYSTVEYDLAAGTRGRRGAAAEALLREVTGAPAALVVNNAAGALLLALGGLARDREVVVSRGQLIEIGDEPSVGQSLAAGADLVLFSGDKLLGGPQAGLLVGRQDLVQRLARNPLARAVRADKLTIAALEVTLATHAAGRRDELPVWRALGLGPHDLRPRAEALAADLGTAATVRDGVSVAGGGSLPGEGLPSVLVEIDPGPAGEQTVLKRLRAADPPVIARAERGRVAVDLRTVPPRQDQAVLQALREALSPGGRAD